MFLSSLFSKKEKERYVGLFLKSEEVIGFVFEPGVNGMTTVSQDRRPFSNGLENVIEDIDDLLIKLEGNSNKRAKQVIFFVYSYFIDEATGEIKQPYKDVVKNILKQLDLRALGYIECFEAISSYLEKRDNHPLNAVLVELDKAHVDVSMYKSGKRIFTKCSARTNAVQDDITAILAEVKGEVLPSRVIVYDSDSVHANVSTLLEHKWENDLFIQIPRIEVIQEEQLHQELSSIFGHQLLQTTETSNQINESKQQEPTEATISPTQPLTPNEPPVSQSQSSLGFVLDGEVTRSEEQQDDPAEKTIPAVRQSAQRKSFAFSIPKLFSTMPKSNVAVRFAWVFGLLLIVGSLFLIEFYLHKASLIVFLPSQAITKQMKEQIDLVGNTTSQLDIQQSTYSASFNESTDTTGQRDIGEKARGEVIIQNFDDQERIITKGTTLESEGKKFILDSEVKVASASETSVGVKQAGKIKANVIADQIGPEGNLSKGKRFKIGDLPSNDYYAINESNFAGGTKKQMRTVAKKDIDDLKAAVLDKAKKESIDTIQKNMKPDEKILNSLTVVKLADFKLTKELGEEANEVAIQATINTEYYFYNVGNVKNYIAESIESDVPDNYKLIASKVDYNINNVEKEGDVLGVQIDINALSVKEADKQELLNKVVGKSKNQIDEILRKEYNATGYTLDIQSPIPFLDTLMPFFLKNIEVETTASS